MTLLKIRYCVTIYVVIFSSPLLGCFPFSNFLSDPLFLNLFLLFTKNYLANNLLVWYCVRGALMGEVGFHG